MAPKITPAEKASASEQCDLIAAMRRVPLFQHCSESSLARLALEMERIEFEAGDLLGPKEGDPQTHMFLITSGRLSRWSHGKMADDEKGGTIGIKKEGFVSGGTTTKTRLVEAPIPIEVYACGAGGGRGRSTVEVTSPDMPGLLAIVSSALKKQNISIQKATVKTMRRDDLKLTETSTASEEGESSSESGKLLALFRRSNSNKDDVSTTVTTTGSSEKNTVSNDNGNASVENVAFEFYDVVDAKTKQPIDDPARMRRVEAAVHSAVEKQLRIVLDQEEEKSRKTISNESNSRKDDGGGSILPSWASVLYTIEGEDEKKRSSGKAEVKKVSYCPTTHSFGALQVIGSQPSWATTTAVTPGVGWRLSSEKLERALRFGWSSSSSPERDPAEHDLAVDVASGLAAEVFRMSETYRTPFLEQPAQSINIAAVSVAAAFESYYRSALNSFLNNAIAKSMSSSSAAATGAGCGAKMVAEAATGSSISVAGMFPNMHVQIPTRVVYINGFKLSRQYLASLVEEPATEAFSRGDEMTHSLYMLAPALLPGVLMTPISSILEACNAGHKNPEPLNRRWIRGLWPRCAREIIFGLGLNNLTDWVEERIPRDVCEGRVMRNALGSITAGVIAGYLSHVPHNLSTMKLLEPSKSYKGHVADMVRSSYDRIPSSLDMPYGTRNAVATGLALLLPKGLAIRTTQVVGSFVLLNGISHLLDQR
mmetsp:Transcript_13644/g.19886  ORF Transcript_13644/g.19886 Transcript_13644/m.19886 type:complete len:708 (-) Transcript_13644:107-2230(-)